MKVFMDGRPTLGSIHRYTMELCRILPKWSGLHTVATCHDLWLIEGFVTKPRGWKKFYDCWNFIRALARADQLITLSHSVADKLKIRYGLNTHRVTRIPPPLADLGPGSEMASPSKPFLLTVGTLEPRKNLERLLRA
jgi:glycosyltransferase involved in cell wall biosynthesis